MKIKYRVFKWYETITVPGWLNFPTEEYKYKDVNQLHDEIAEFITELGDKFVSMSGGDFRGWENRCGLLVVWYRD